MLPDWRDEVFRRRMEPLIIVLFFRSVPEDKFHGYVGMEFLTEHPEHDLALAAKRLSPIDPQNRKINWSSPDEGRADAGGTLFRF